MYNVGESLAFKLSVASQLAAAQIERRLSVTNLSSENKLTDVSTECFSRHHTFTLIIQIKDNRLLLHGLHFYIENLVYC